MELTELEFKIYSNALVKLTRIIDFEFYSRLKSSNLEFVNFPIESFSESIVPFDFIEFDVKKQSFKILYDKWVGDRVERFQIKIPNWIFQDLEYNL